MHPTDTLPPPGSGPIPAHCDILIVGGGPVGGALALALRNTGLTVLVAEARTAPVDDARALAVSHASAAQLARLGLVLDAEASAIHTVHVSQSGGFGRVYLRGDDLGLAALGHVLPYGALCLAIHRALGQAAAPAQAAAPFHYCSGTTVAAVQPLAEYAAVHLQQAGGGEALVTCRLVVLAEGGALLAGLGIHQTEKDYHQHALVATVSASQPHHNTAYERFAADGPIALLPWGAGEQQPGRYALIWTRPQPDPLQVASMSDTHLLAALQQRMGDRAGRFTAIGPRSQFPLRLRWADQATALRVAVVGNAAQTLHPVAGQGFNLGLRDALALARVLRDTPPEAVGRPAMLQRYRQQRHTDSHFTRCTTDGLISLFAHRDPLVHAGRAAGLALLDTLRPLRQGFAERMVFGYS